MKRKAKGMRTVIAVALVSTGIAFFGTAAVAAESCMATYKGKKLVFQTWGGPWGDSLTKIVDNANSQFGTKVQIIFHENSTIGISKVRATKANPVIDVQMSIESEALAAKNEGLIAKMNTGAVSNWGSVRNDVKDSDGTFVGLYTYPMGLIVRTDIVDAPKNFADLWTETYRNNVAVPDISWAGGHHVIVLAAKLSGGDESNIDAGFKALADLRKSGNIKAFYSSDDDAIRMVSAGEVGVVISLLPNAIDFADDKNVEFVYPADLPVREAFDVIWPVAGGKVEYATCLIDYLLGAEAQKAHSDAIAVIPVNTKVTISDRVKELSPPEGKATFIVDESVVVPVFQDWVERFNREVVAAN